MLNTATTLVAHESPTMRRAAILSLIAAMSFTGANVPFGKAIVLEVPVLVFLAFRFAVASIALLAVAHREPGPTLTALPTWRWLDIAILAAIGSVLFTLFMLEGTKRTAAVDAGIITATIPAVVALIGAAVSQRWPTTAQTLLITLAVAGLIAIQLGGNAAGAGGSWQGNALVGAAVLCEATFVVVSQRMSALVRPIRLSLAVSVMSLAFCLPLAAFALDGFDPFAVRPEIWLLALWYALSSSVFCTVLWYRGAALVPTWLAGLATAALPVTAIAVAAAFLGEPVSAAQFAGATLVIVAIVVGALAKDRPEPVTRRPPQQD